MSEQEISVLIHEFDYLLKSEINRRIGHLNLAAEQTRILLLLGQHEEMCQNEIAEKLEKDKANVTRMISSLESKGFVTRYKDADNWKRKLVRLTILGEAATADIQKISVKLNADLSKGIEQEELALFYNVIHRLRANIGR